MKEGRGVRQPTVLVLMFMQSLCTPGEWRLGWGAVRDEAGEMVRD